MKAVLSWGHFGGWGEGGEQGRMLGNGRFKGFNLDFVCFHCWYEDYVPFVILVVLLILWIFIVSLGVAGTIYYNQQKLRDHIVPYINKCSHTIVFISYFFYFPLVYHCLKRIGCGDIVPAVVMLAFLVLLPLVFVVVGYHKRHLRTHPTTVAIFGFLYGSFEYNFWWIISLFMSRKLIMVFIAAFTEFGPWLTYVLFISMGLVAYFKPFRSSVKIISFLSYKRYIEVGMGNLADIAVCFWLLFSVMHPYVSYGILIVDIVGITIFYAIFLWSARQKYLQSINDSEHVKLLEEEDRRYSPNSIRGVLQVKEEMHRYIDLPIIPNNSYSMNRDTSDF